MLSFAWSFLAAFLRAFLEDHRFLETARAAAGSKLGLAGFAAANPEDPRALPCLEVARDKGDDCNVMPLAKRADPDRVSVRMRRSPEWSQVVGKRRQWHTIQRAPAGAHDTVSQPSGVQLENRLP